MCRRWISQMVTVLPFLAIGVGFYFLRASCKRPDEFKHLPIKTAVDPLGRRVTLNVVNADINDVLKRLLSKAQVQYRLERVKPARVSVNLVNMPCSLAVASVMRSTPSSGNDLHLVEENGV